MIHKINKNFLKFLHLQEKKGREEKRRKEGRGEKRKEESRENGVKRHITNYQNGGNKRNFWGAYE